MSLLLKCKSFFFNHFLLSFFVVKFEKYISTVYILLHLYYTHSRLFFYKGVRAVWLHRNGNPADKDVDTFKYTLENWQTLTLSAVTITV